MLSWFGQILWFTLKLNIFSALSTEKFTFHALLVLHSCCTHVLNVSNEWHDIFINPLWSQWRILSVRYCGRREFHEEVQGLLYLHVSVSFSSKDKSILGGKLSVRRNCYDANWPSFISCRLVIILWVIRWEGPVNWCSVEHVTKIQRRNGSA